MANEEIFECQIKSEHLPYWHCEIASARAASRRRSAFFFKIPTLVEPTSTRARVRKKNCWARHLHWTRSSILHMSDLICLHPFFLLPSVFTCAGLYWCVQRSVTYRIGVFARFTKESRRSSKEPIARPTCINRFHAA